MEVHRMAEPEKVIPSVCGQYRAEIARLPVGGFTVTIFQWKKWWAPEYGKVGEGWDRVSRGVTIADTLERAEVLAEEEFRSLGTTGPAPAGE
jgi:hypothetical protein